MNPTPDQAHTEDTVANAEGSPQPGDLIPELTWVPSEIQLFRYSAATWNGHRIHYDQSYARSEGYPGVLVQSHLHGAMLTRLFTDWISGRGHLRRLSVSVRRYAVPGDVLVCRGTVTAVTNDAATGTTRVDIDLEEARPSDFTVCAIGKAQVEFPGTTGSGEDGPA
jgi:hydroxyacyl-ACP dehydratase HTD2-like protein with hotdog domain